LVIDSQHKVRKGKRGTMTNKHSAAWSLAKNTDICPNIAGEKPPHNATATNSRRTDASEEEKKGARDKHKGWPGPAGRVPTPGGKKVVVLGPNQKWRRKKRRKRGPVDTVLRSRGRGQNREGGHWGKMK